MRKATVIKGFKNSQKIRVILEGVGFYMTVGEIEHRFISTNHRTVVAHTLDMMAKEKCGGIMHTVKGYDHKMTPISVLVQVDLM
jgi:hypothetical protein